jgi:hypothetical protein
VPVAWPARGVSGGMRVTEKRTVTERRKCGGGESSSRRAVQSTKVLHNRRSGMAWRWERRKSGEYLYTAFRIGGRVVKSYLAKSGPMRSGMNVLMRDRQERDRKEREERRRASTELRSRVAGVLRSGAEANAELRVAAEAVLITFGFRRHERGDWRMKRKTSKNAELATGGSLTPDTPSAGKPVPYHGTPPNAPPPLIEYHPLKNWLDDADELFAAARAGDGDAQDRLRAALRADEHVRDHFGDIGTRATKTLIARFAGGDAVLAIGIEEKVRAMRAKLLGDNPTVLDQLLVRRVINGWVAVHALELEQAINPPSRPGDRAYLEAAVGKASKRYTQAITELARVRRLNLPPILVNVTSPSPPPPPRMAEAEVIGTTEVATAEQLPTGGAKRGKGVMGLRRRAAQ